MIIRIQAAVQKSELHHTTLQLYRKMSYKTAIALVINRVKDILEGTWKANMISLKGFPQMWFPLAIRCGSPDILVPVYCFKQTYVT